MALRFLNPRTPRSAKELSPTTQAQLRAAGKLYDGNDLPAEERLSPDREHGDGEDEGSFLGLLEIWDVEVDGEVRYDALLYMGDSGTVFRRGTQEVVAERIQTYFEGKDKALSKEMQQAYHAAQKQFKAELKAGPKAGGAWGAYSKALDKSEDEN
jgi:hypothetical protein